MTTQQKKKIKSNYFLHNFINLLVNWMLEICMEVSIKLNNKKVVHAQN
jgi:hypothetical protein